MPGQKHREGVVKTMIRLLLVIAYTAATVSLLLLMRAFSESPWGQPCGCWFVIGGNVMRGW